jgi:tetratricopeptide (TPR) repeat protein
MKPRRWSWVGGALALSFFGVVALSTTAGHAEEKKKKPGLWDFETWKLPSTREREAAKSLAPGELDLEPLGSFDTPPRAVRLRFYADRDYRAGVLHWREKMRAELERVNQVAERVFNVRFEIESLRDWDETHAGAGLDPLLGALEKLDDAHDVDWVVGLVTPFRGVATSIHQIGVARLMARSFVMRAMDDEEEGRVLAREFSKLTPEEREKLYADRKAHKETVIFLHEWAHTMGALHLEEATMIMNTVYDPRQAAFSDFEKRLVGAVLDARLADRAHPYPESAKALGLVEKAPREEGSDKDRAGLVELLRARSGRGGAPAVVGSGSGPAAPSGATLAARTTIDQAMERVRAGDLAAATPLVFAAAKQTAGGPPDAPTQVKLAAAAGAVGALSTADAALGRLDPNARPAKLVNELEATRARVALPHDAAKAGVAPEDEPRYVAAFWRASNAAEADDPMSAERQLAALAKDFPDSVGREVVACELGVRRKRYAEAEKHCAAAIVKDPGALRAHLAFGRLTARTRRNVDAEKHFRRAILLDPTDDVAWVELSRLYRSMGAATQAAQLERERETLRAAGP